MKNILRKLKITFLAFSGLLLFGAAPGISQDIILDFGGDISVRPGDEVTVDVKTSDLTGLDIRNFEFEIAFDENAITVTSGDIQQGPLTLTEGGLFTSNVTDDNRILVNFADAEAIEDEGILFSFTGVIGSPGVYESGLTVNSYFIGDGTSEVEPETPFNIQIQSADVAINFPKITAITGQDVLIAIETDDLSELDLVSFEIEFTYDTDVLSFDSEDNPVLENTLSEAAVVAFNETEPGVIALAGAFDTPIGSGDVLLYLNAEIGMNEAVSDLTFTKVNFFDINGGQVPIVGLDGSVNAIFPFTTLFQLSTIDNTLPEWFGTHTERGMSAYGDNVYVVSRSDGANVLVLDAETGEVTDTLNTEGVSGGTFPLNDVEVSGDGRIYAGNLAIGDAATFKLYELHRTRAPRVVLEFAHPGNNRLGDKLTIVGNWNDGGLTLYAPDGVSAQVFKFEMNGNENGLFGEPEIIGLDVVDAGASPAVAPLADGRFFWTASGHNVHFFEADGTHIGQVSSEIAATSSTALRFIGTEGDDYLLAVYQHGHVSPVGENENIRVVRIPGGDLEEAVVEFITPSMRGTTNPNGTGAVDLVLLDNGNFNLFVLGTNNGIGGYNVTRLDVTFPDYSKELEFMPLAQARALPDGRMAMVKGMVNSTDFGFGVADYFIQDESGGLNVTDFVEGGAQKGTVVEPGDSIIIMGEIATFRNQRNIEVGSFEITSRDNPLPEPIVIEGSDMVAESEFQGMRVQLRNMYIIEEDIDAWPEDGVDTGSGVNIRITSEAEADTFVVRLARNNTAFGEGAGQPLPPAVFHITGTMGQFQQTTQLFPFFADDIVPAAEINWANLQWPPQGDIKEGEEFIVYAQIYVEGITDVSDEASEDIQAWIGVNTENLAPTADGWTWIEAEFNEDKGNNHEYMADIGSGLPVGTYYYVSRFQLQEFDFVYGGFSGGFWDGENNVSGQLTVAEPTDAELADIPMEFGIDQNYPNPFNPVTNIQYAVPQTALVTIEVFSVTGQRVATLVNETRDAGYHTVSFDASRLASGVYIYRMRAADFTQTKKLMLVK